MFRSVRDGGDKGEFVAAGLRTPFVQFIVWSLLDLHKKKLGCCTLHMAMSRP